MQNYLHLNCKKKIAADFSFSMLEGINLWYSNTNVKDEV